MEKNQIQAKVKPEADTLWPRGKAASWAFSSHFILFFITYLIDLFFKMYFYFICIRVSPACM